MRDRGHRRGAGSSAAAVCRRLAADGDEPIGIDLAGADRRADVADPASTVAALGGADAVVHAAALVSERGRMAEFVRVNTRGTRNVLDAAAGPPRRRARLGRRLGLRVRARARARTPAAPCGIPYIDTKGATETLALRRGATVIRPGDVYGPGSQPWVVRPLEMMRAGRFFLPAPGDGLITPVFVDDLVDAIVRALREPRAAGRAYTVWDGEAVTAREFFGHHARVARPGPASASSPPRCCALAGACARRRPGGGHVHVTRRADVPEHARPRGARLEPRLSLAEGMARTLG